MAAKLVIEPIFEADFQKIQLWIPTEEERDPGPGSHPGGGQPWAELRRGCGHSRLL
jgi:hypothetical protein